LFTVTQTFIQNKLVHIRDIINLRYEEFAEIHENPEHANDGLVHTGFKSLDGKIGGFKPGDMIILAARPSMGKTALALNIAQHIGEGGKNVAVFSLEMSKEQLTDRLICATMGVDSWKLNKGLLEDDEFMRMGDALERLSKANIYIDDSAAGNLLEIKSKARRLKIESGLDFIVIDYLQLMSAGNPMNRVQEISDISRGIKSLARELGVPIMALSQLSRAVESRVSKEPILSDLRESGSIEQDADVVLMIYREDYYDEFTENKGITNVFVRKNRNGPVGGADLKFEKKYMKFYDLERSREGGYED
ncbi:TPA: replicative DNA helicase, partial [Candidatus Gracilibacteria bacterium]|nr:replicative DNA helicase [Candidatus Gracilibacteria bacterium]